MRAPLPFAFAAALAVLAASRGALAFCQSSACPPRPDGSTQGQTCTPAGDGDCGVPLQWRQPCIGFNVAAQASTHVTLEEAESILQQAFAAWAAVDCGGEGPPSIEVFDLGVVSCANVEYNQHAGNTNVLVFRDDGWPHESDASGGNADTLALTTVTYDVEKGDIYDADIEVNTAMNTFTTTEDPGPNDYDLLGVLTHEVGHFLGLAHSPVDGATMFATYNGGPDIRTLEQDDMDAICKAYPPGREAVGDCTGIPRHGFAPECGQDQTYVKCGTSRAGGEGGSAMPLAALALALAALRGRSARRGS
jgi:hypothetical protein